MPAHHSLHVALTMELRRFVERLVGSGRYQSSSEVVRAGLRLLERSEALPPGPPNHHPASPTPSKAENSRKVDLARHRLPSPGRLAELVLENSADFAVLTISLDGTITSWNSAAECVMGWTEDEAVGRKACMIFTPEDQVADICGQEMAEARSNGRAPDERWHIRRDGTRFWGSGSMTRLEDDETGEHIGYVKIVRDRTEQHLAGERLRASEAVLRGVFENSADCLKLLTLDGRLIRMNGPGLGMLGFSSFEEARGKDYVSFWPEGERDRVKGALAEAATGGVGRFHGRGPADTPRWWDVQVTPVPGEDGRPELLVASSRDVTERERSREALRISEARFRLMANAVPQIVWITDAEGRNEFYNEQWFAYTGAPLAPVTAAETVTSYVHPEDATRTIDGFDEARRRGSTFLIEHRLRSKDGSYRWFLVRGEPHRDPRTSRIIRWFGTSVDIHDRINAEESNACLAAIVTSTTDAVIAFAAESGRILAWNRGAEELFGYAETEALDKPAGLLVPPDLPDGDPTGVFRRVMDGARVHEHETARVAKSGERIPVTVTASRMLAADGRIIGVAAIFRDLRQRKQIEARQALLSREVDHRAKNALAVVQATLRLTQAPDLPSYVQAITGRVTALARAQTLLADEQWTGADLQTMLTAEMDVFLSGLSGGSAGETRATLAGPAVALPAGAAQPLAMVVHELATNATKHGALSMPGGRLAVTWSLDGGRPEILQLRWTETGGPPIAAPPTRRGFGSRVLNGVVQGQLRGKLSLSWNESGLICEIEVPLVHGAGASGGNIAAD